MTTLPGVIAAWAAVRSTTAQAIGGQAMHRTSGLVLGAVGLAISLSCLPDSNGRARDDGFELRSFFVEVVPSPMTKCGTPPSQQVEENFGPERPDCTLIPSFGAPEPRVLALWCGLEPRPLWTGKVTWSRDAVSAYGKTVLTIGDCVGEYRVIITLVYPQPMVTLRE